MGTYLNPGKEAYEEAVRSEIYVDKSELILYLNSIVRTKQKYVSVSRPRRFGKTMAADMICAYYDRTADSGELFEHRKLADGQTAEGKPWNIYLGKFDVIRLVMTDFLKSSKCVDEMLSYLTEEVMEELKEAYPEINPGKRQNLCTYMNRIHGKTNRQFVIVIDEWDALFRGWKEDTEGQIRYLDFLCNWLKDKPYIALAYMTGILPIKKTGRQSGLNMFDEYSMMSPMQFAPFTGFTEDEVKTLCNRYGRDYEGIRAWYRGYEVRGIADHNKLKENACLPEGTRYALYSPLSVVEAMTTGVIRNYWNQTETYEALAEYIRRDYDGLKDAVALLMDGGRLRIDTSTYQNDMTTFYGRDDVLSLLIHLGYLGYDDERSEVFIPNREILDEFRTSTKGSEWIGTFEQYGISQELLKATWEGNVEKVAELVEKAHNKAGNKTYNDESALSYGIQLAYYAAQKYYTTILELDSGKGYADIVYLPSPKYPEKPVLLIELKHEKNVESAMTQIKRQEYPDRLLHYKGNILLVSINYNRDVPNDSPEFKHHSCMIERA